MQVWGKLRANDWGVKPDEASALVWGAGCGLVDIYSFVFEPYRGTCESTKWNFWENYVWSFNTIKISAKFLLKKDIW